jgi:hypothetical protein
MTRKPTAAARASKERAEPSAVASEQQQLAVAAAKKETSSALERSEPGRHATAGGPAIALVCSRADGDQTRRRYLLVASSRNLA